MKRKYTRFGIVLKIVLTVSAVLSFIMILGSTGSYELDNITTAQYLVRLVPSLSVLVGSVLTHNFIFD